MDAEDGGGAAARMNVEEGLTKPLQYPSGVQKKIYTASAPARVCGWDKHLNAPFKARHYYSNIFTALFEARHFTKLLESISGVSPHKFIYGGGTPDKLSSILFFWGETPDKLSSVFSKYHVVMSCLIFGQNLKMPFIMHVNMCPHIWGH